MGYGTEEVCRKMFIITGINFLPIVYITVMFNNTHPGFNVWCKNLALDNWKFVSIVTWTIT